MNRYHNKSDATKEVMDSEGFSDEPALLCHRYQGHHLEAGASEPLMNQWTLFVDRIGRAGSAELTK